jgi:hypothetical protein
MRHGSARSSSFTCHLQHVDAILQRNLINLRSSAPRIVISLLFILSNVLIKKHEIAVTGDRTALRRLPICSWVRVLPLR